MSIEDHLKMALEVYNRVNPKSRCEVPNLAKERMVLVTDEELTPQDLREKMSYYGSWVAYLQADYHRWKFVATWLDSTYKDEYDKLLSMDTGQKKYEKEASIAIELKPLKEAKLIADSRMESCKNDLQTATNMKEIVSRQITLKGIEIQGIGRE